MNSHREHNTCKGLVVFWIICTCKTKASSCYKGHVHLTEIYFILLYEGDLLKLFWSNERKR